MKFRWKEPVKIALRAFANVPYVVEAAAFITRQVDTSTPSYEIREVAPIQPQVDTSESLRLNLLIPSINVSDAFGGIVTAVRIFEQLGKIVQSTSDVRLRIITDARITDESVVDLAKWRLLQSESPESRYEIVQLADNPTRAVRFSRRDVLVATWWPTAFRAERVRAWQEQVFGSPVAPLIYIIQDFEPAFYPWSSRYAYAETTYLDGANTIAIFNTSLLRRYFEKHGYSFLKTYEFEPRISSSLRQYLKANSATTKKRRILVYGRPSSVRNCFEVICAGLREWARKSPHARNWTVISAGEEHPNVPIGNGCEIASVGKLSLPAYAALLSECAVGVSLMLSPHPSYPPLEMAYSGLLTITNSYGDKNLSSWHDNIYSIARIVPEELAKGIEMCVGRFEEDNSVGLKGDGKAPFYASGDEDYGYLYDVARCIGVV
jgi:hypothetical protein